ncbi:MAG: hypothetical protein WC689_04765 [Methylocystis sp.]|jgi:hypothetical protein
MRKIVIFTCCAFTAMSSLAIAKPPSVSAVNAVLAQRTAAARKAEINRQISKACNISLSESDLSRASALVETHRKKGAAWIAAQINNSELSFVCG